MVWSCSEQSMARVVTGLVTVTRWPVCAAPLLGGHENLAAASPSTSPGHRHWSGLRIDWWRWQCVVTSPASPSTTTPAPPGAWLLHRDESQHLPGATTWSGVNMTDPDKTHCQLLYSIYGIFNCSSDHDQRKAINSRMVEESSYLEYIYIYANDTVTHIYLLIDSVTISP